MPIRSGRWLLLFWLLCASVPQARAATPEAGAPLPGLDEAPPLLQLGGEVKPLGYALALSLDPGRDRFSGTVAITVALEKPRARIWLHGRNLHVTEASAEVGGQRVQGKYQQHTDQGVASLTLASALPVGNAVLRFAWDAAWDEQLAGLYRVHAGSAPYVFTQFEVIDARKAFPCFDEPIFKTPFEVELLVPEGQVAIANTAPIAEEKAPGGMRRVRFSTTAPLPTYLVAFAVGPLDVVAPPPLPPTPERLRPLQIRGVAPRGRGPQLAYALQAGGELIPILERYFAIGFPYEKLDHLAVPDFSYGAMENAGAITYREQLLLHEEGKNSRESLADIATVMAHEMAHQWFGDLVTLRWWTDAWLNESFATWMEGRAVQEWRPELRANLELLKGVHEAMLADGLASARQIRQPVLRTEEIWNQFDTLTYQKGGGVLSMFERYAGAEKFRQGIRAYLHAHANGGGSTDELLLALEQAAGKPVAAPFRTFLEQPGVPLVEAEVHCADPAKAAPATAPAELLLRQSRWLPVGSAGAGSARAQRWQIPICARYASGGQEHESCTLLAEERGSLPLVGCPDWVIPNADAAGYYRWSLALPDLRKLTSAGYPKLGERERASLGSNLKASFSAVSLPASDVLSALEPLARDPDEAVATQPMALLDEIRERMIPASLRPGMEAYARSLYQGSSKKLRWDAVPDETPMARRYRLAVLNFVTQVARDPEQRRLGAQRGRAYANLGGKALAPAAVDPDLARLSLVLAVQDGDARLWNGLARRLAQLDDGAMRANILTALGNSWDPALSARALDLALDPQLRKNERTTVLWQQLAWPETRARAWRWLRKNYDKLVPLLSENSAASLPAAPVGFCDEARLAEMEAFFRPRVGRTPSAERNLTEAEEALRLCAAEAAAQRGSVEAFFKARRLKKR